MTRGKPNHGWRRRALALLLGGSAASCSLTPDTPLPAAARDGIHPIEYEMMGTPLTGLSGGTPGGGRILYVHGSPGRADNWLRFLTDPIPGSESIALDRPGYGTGNDRRTVPSLARQAAALRPLLVERNGAWPILVGHSLGGPIILRAAADYPDRVAAVVLVAGAIDPVYEELRWYNYLAKGLAWILPGSLRRSNEEMWDLRRELWLLDEELPRVQCPVWIVHGTSDGLVPVEGVDYVEERLPQAETVLLDGAGHFILWQSPWRESVRDVIERAFQTAHASF